MRHLRAKRIVPHSELRCARSKAIGLEISATTSDYLNDSTFQDNENIPDDAITSIEAVLQLSTQFRNYVNDNKTTFDSEISDGDLNSIITTIKNQYGNIDVVSLELPERRFVDGFTDNDRIQLSSAISLAGGIDGNS